MLETKVTQMKVLHILNEIKFSGAETMLASAANLWQEKGLELSALSTSDIEGAYADVLRQNGYTIFHIPYVKSIGFVIRIYRFLKQEKFDVVHIHPERGYFQYALAAWLAGAPVKVRTVHHIFAFESWHAIRPWFLRHCCKYIFGVQFVSNSLSGHATEKRLHGFDNPYIPNWFDSRIYNREAIAQNKDTNIREQCGIASDKILLVSLGGNSEYKNYDKVIEALGDDVLRDRFVYLHIGHDDKQELPKMALEHNVTFISKGCVPDTLPYLLAADLVMMPSREEGFGIAAVEAMALGAPLCLSTRPALIDFKQFSDKLFWCEPTVEGIRTFLGEFKKLSEAERKAISESLTALSDRFTIEQGATAYYNLYLSLSKKSTCTKR
jgi:glycosyltransferase involved in cell wall biosynthesis